MISQYEFSLKAWCPVDSGSDHYAVIVRSRSTVSVETMVATAKRFATEPLFQEELTEKIARQLCAEVTTIGYHSGVKTTCCAGLL